MSGENGKQENEESACVHWGKDIVVKTMKHASVHWGKGNVGKTLNLRVYV